MVQQDDPAGVLTLDLVQHGAEGADLEPAQPAGGEGRWRGDRGRHADQGDRATPAQKGEGVALAAAAAVAAHVVRPMRPGLAPLHLDIGVVVAWNHRDVLWRSQLAQPDRRLDELRRQRDVDQIAGDRDVVRLLLAQIRHQRVEHFAAMDAVAASLPGNVAQDPLVEQGTGADPRHWPQVQVGQVGQAKIHAPVPVAGGHGRSAP